MGSLNAEYALRVPLATWFRFRAAAERLQSNVLLLTQHACSRNSAGLVLRLDPGSVLSDGSTVFTGLEHRAELARQRFPQDNVFPLRKQPQSVQTAQWQARTVWAGLQMTARYACLDVREFPLQALLRLRPELQRKPVAVLDGEPPFEQVCSLNGPALDSRDSARHDKVGNGDVSCRRRIAAFARGGGSSTRSLAGVCRNLLPAGGRSEQ